ncbi:MAG: alpha-L-arabinofuranosidase [Chitinophagaceae bacterium]|nr:alpha-L-arabinofuranosidase [Chitinophagaceae bacterium]
MKFFLNHKVIAITGTAILFVFMACKKTNSTPVPVPPATVADTIPTDPATAATIGFFIDNWHSKNFTSPSGAIAQPLTANPATVAVTVNTGQVITRIAPNYFGNNSNLWCGQLNSQAMLMNHLINYQPRIIRGPAGSVSDVFFFNANNNSAPADAPANLVKSDGTTASAGYWFGKNNESWTFSIDGYYNLLQQTNSIGLLTVNYGYARYGTGANPVAAAAHLAADWVRYDRGRTKYWEVGNECFGDWEAGYRINTATNQDGQPEIVTGALYGRHFKVFADSMRSAAAAIGVEIKIGAVLYDTEPQSWNTSTIKTWNSGYFAEAGNAADYYAVHNYFTPYQQNSTVATIFSSAASVPLAVKNYVKTGIAAAGLTLKPIAMTEWNMFCSGSKQNVSSIAGIHSVLTLGELLANTYGAALRWDLANRWDNGDDHGFFNYGDEPGVEQWNPRPAFYYMYYFQKTTGDRLLASSVAGSTDIVSIATSFSSGQKGVVLVNKGAAEKTVSVDFKYFTPGSKFYYYTLKGGSDNGDFSRMVFVNGNGPANNLAGGPSAAYTSIGMNATNTANGIKITLSPKTVVYVVVDKR